VETRRKLAFESEKAMLSIIEPKSVKEDIKIKDWIKSMNEELDQMEKNQTWELLACLQQSVLVIDGKNNNNDGMLIGKENNNEERNNDGKQGKHKFRRRSEQV
jgi:hypothetical protein